jgi:sugar phosphate isomerase/epimerase
VPLARVGSGSLDGFPVDRIAIVHVNDAPQKPPSLVEDADRLLPGDGVIALASLLRGLSDGGYAGPFSLETFNPRHWAEDPEAICVRGLAAIRGMLRMVGGPSA